MITFKGRHTPKPIILQCVRWYCAYALSYRNIEEMMAERGLIIDHSTLNRWVVHYAPKLEKAFHKKKRRPGDRWRMDETYIKVKVKGKWKYYYRAVDKEGSTIDFLLTAKRDTKAALRFFNKAIGRNRNPGLINIDKSGANKAGINQFNDENNRRMKIRQCKYLNNIIEQDHRRVKRITRLMLGFKNFRTAQSTLAGIELVAMLKKGQMKKNRVGALSPAEQFYALAA
ncbi:MAG: putative transposase [Candidatus Azotimanducaceae bacterium]|jgi:putative transposase